MNLHAIATRFVSKINPAILGTVQVSTGSTISADGTPVPSYAAAVQVMIQVQALNTRDLMFLDGLGVQGSTHKLYLSGQVEGLVRPQGKGGDLIQFADPNSGLTQIWLVTALLEGWPEWSCLAATLQT